MRILILSINYWPEVTGIGAFTTYRAEYLAAAGHDVEVCTTFPYYPDWKVQKEYAGRWALTEKRNGVRIVRSRCYVPYPVTSIRRILHEASFIAAAAIRALLRKRPDLLLVVSPPLGLAVPAILFSRLWRVPYVFDVEDLQPDSAADLGMLPRWAVRLLYRLEHAAYRHASRITTLTPCMKARIAAKGFAEEKIRLIEPRMDMSLVELTRAEADAFRRKFGLGEKFLVVHSGNMGIKQGLDVMVDAAALARADSGLLFLCVGAGADRQRIERRAAALHLSNLRFLPLLDEQDFRGLLASSGICLVTQQQSVAEIVFPSKIVTYLAAGRPVVASVHPACEVARVILESGAGKVAEAENPVALLDAIRALQCEDVQTIAENARQYARARWSPERVMGELERCLLTASGCGAHEFAAKGVQL